MPKVREWAGFSARFHAKIQPVGVEIFEMNRRYNLEHKQATRNFAEKFDRRTTTRWVGYDLPCQIMITNYHAKKTKPTFKNYLPIRVGSFELLNCLFLPYIPYMVVWALFFMLTSAQNLSLLSIIEPYLK